MFKGIGHIALTVGDMEKSIHFYCNVLGFSKAFELQKVDKPTLVYIKVLPGQFIELFPGNPEKLPAPANHIGFRHLCIEVDDIHAVVKHLKAHSVELDSEIRQGGDKNYQLWIKDPDGNRIELMQIHPESPQALHSV